MNDLCQFLLVGESQKLCRALVGHDNKIQQFSDSLDALIGAPIFTSLYCPSYSKEIALSDCKNIGLAGLVY
nr:hypothetical protein [Candidatus Aramenus sulfurataquae]